MARNIKFTYAGREITYKTLKGAQKRAQRLIGRNAVRGEAEGQAKARSPSVYGFPRTLSFEGCTFEELCPPSCDCCNKFGPVTHNVAADLFLSALEKKLALRPNGVFEWCVPSKVYVSVQPLDFMGHIGAVQWAFHEVLEEFWDSMRGVL